VNATAAARLVHRRAGACFDAQCGDGNRDGYLSLGAHASATATARRSKVSRLRESNSSSVPRRPQVLTDSKIERISSLLYHGSCITASSDGRRVIAYLATMPLPAWHQFSLTQGRQQPIVSAVRGCDLARRATA